MPPGQLANFITKQKFEAGFSYSQGKHFRYLFLGKCAFNCNPQQFTSGTMNVYVQRMHKSGVRSVNIMQV